VALSVITRFQDLTYKQAYVEKLNI